MNTGAPITPRWHGTAGGYSNHDCRCDACRQAHLKAMYEDRQNRVGTKPPKGVRHGSESTYSNWRCQCAKCLKAHREYTASRKALRRQGVSA